MERNLVPAFRACTGGKKPAHEKRNENMNHEAKKNVNLHVQASTNFPPNAFKFPSNINTLTLRKN